MYYLKALRTLINGKQTEVILLQDVEEQLYLCPIIQITSSDHIFIFNEHEKNILESLIEKLQSQKGYEVFRITSYYDTNDFIKLLTNTEELTYSSIQFCKL